MKQLKGKVGRPKGSTKDKLVKTDDVTMARLALNQVEHADRISQIGGAVNVLATQIQEIINSSNKANQSLANAHQTLAKRVEALELTVRQIKDACKEESSLNPDDNGNDLERKIT